MPYLMFIRHSYKKYKNNKGPIGCPLHDPPIKEGFNRTIISKNLNYFKTYGEPNKIITSPFLRARQTTKIISYILPPETEITIDKDLEEYLGFQKPIGGKADLDDETLKYTQPLLGVENFEKLKIRSLNYYKKINKDNKDNILIVTHGIFIFQLAVQLGLKLNNIKELEGIIIKDGKIKLIF